MTTKVHNRGSSDWVMLLMMLLTPSVRCFTVVNAGQTWHALSPGFVRGPDKRYILWTLAFHSTRVGAFRSGSQLGYSCKTGIRGSIPRIGRSRLTRRALAFPRKVIVPAPTFRQTSTRL